MVRPASASFLPLQEPWDATQFKGEIRGPRGGFKGAWDARLYADLAGFSRWKHVDHPAVAEALARLPEARWPMAVLHSILIEPRYENQGLGTAALEAFVREARALGAQLALGELGWPRQRAGDIERNLRFYLARGWAVLAGSLETLPKPVFLWRAL